MTLEEIMAVQIGANVMRDYAVSLAIFVASIVVLKAFKHIVLKKLKDVASKTKGEFDDEIINFVSSIHWYFYVLLAVYVASRNLTLPPLADGAINFFIIAGITYNVVYALQKMVDLAAKDLIRAKEKEEQADTHDISVIETLAKIFKVALWLIALLFVMSNLGYNVNTLLAGLGVGGIAIAFALQNVLSDIFSWFTIYFDKPFREGDFIVVDKDMGTVKKIGIKSTRLQTLQGEEMIISNRELTSVRVQNFKKMEKRRIVFTFGLVYQTSTAKIKRALDIVKDVIEKVELAELDRAHFKKFGESSLDFEVVYYIKSPDYKAYMDTQEQLNLQIKEKFEKEKIEFAYPTRTVYTSKTE